MCRKPNFLHIIMKVCKAPLQEQGGAALGPCRVHNSLAVYTEQILMGLDVTVCASYFRRAEERVHAVLGFLALRIMPSTASNRSLPTGPGANL